jgi:hypothetical protein
VVREEVPAEPGDGAIQEFGALPLEEMAGSEDGEGADDVGEGDRRAVDDRGSDDGVGVAVQHQRRGRVRLEQQRGRGGGPTEGVFIQCDRARKTYSSRKGSTMKDAASVVNPPGPTHDDDWGWSLASSDAP